MSKNKISRKLLKKHAEAVKQLPTMALIEIDEESLKPVIDYSKIWEANPKINYGDVFKGRKINFSDPKNSLYLEIPTDLPEDVQDTMEFVRNWASSPTTQDLWLKNKEATKGFKYKVKMLEIQREIDNLQKDIASYNTPTKQDKLKELLNKLHAYERSYTHALNQNTDFNQTVKDMYLRQRASFEAPLYMLDTNETYGLERVTQSDDPEITDKYKRNYQDLIDSIDKRFDSSENTRGLGGWSPSAGISIAAYKEKQDLQLNPFHEFGHVGWTGVGGEESAPANMVEQILREEGLYYKPYFIETSRTQEKNGTYSIEGYVEPMDKTRYNNAGREAYNRLMDMRILNNIHPDDREWTEERVKTLKDNNLIKRYGARVVARMLNEVAQANPSNLDIQAPEQMYDFDPNEGIDYVKKGKKLLPKYQGGTNGSGVKRLDILSLKRDPEYVNNYNWRINDANIEALLDSLIGRNAGYPQRLATLAMVIPENGGNTTAHGNGAYGLVGWRGDRAVNLPEDFAGQAHKLMVELFANPTGKDWTHGGKGTGVMTGREMYELFNTTPNTSQATKAIMNGYVRPESSEHQKRIDFTQLLKRHMK